MFHMLRIRQRLLQLGVLDVEDRSVAGVGDIHPAKLGLPLAERGASDAVAAADVSCRELLFLLLLLQNCGGSGPPQNGSYSSSNASS